MKTCMVEGCGRRVNARGCCHTHYERLRKHGSPHVVLIGGAKPNTAKPVWLRLVLNVERDANGCWLWQRQVGKTGYAQMNISHVKVFTHRASYEAFVGPIPSGLEIDHLCRVTHCINPDHLEPVTRAENQRRRSAAYTHCIRGHEFSPENTRLRKTGRGRICIACTRIRSRAHRPKASVTV